MWNSSTTNTWTEGAPAAALAHSVPPVAIARVYCQLAGWPVCLWERSSCASCSLSPSVPSVSSPQVWVKPSAEMQFLYGNHVLKNGLGRITENTPGYTGVVVYSMSGG